jgi:KUP system potassium uptake protein
LVSGLAVIWDMLLTSHFVTLVIITVWRLPVIFALGYFLIFATVEATYLSSAVVKIPTGAEMRAGCNTWVILPLICTALHSTANVNSCLLNAF